MSRRRKPVKKRSLLRTGPAQPSNERSIVVLFADIVGSSEISNYKSLKEYNKFLNSFQSCFKTVCEHYKKEEYEEHEHPFFKGETRGDEGCLMVFVSKSDDSLAKDIDVAINIALDLKRKWLFVEDNVVRIRQDGLLPVDLGIGIHTGKVFVNKEDNDEYRPEGYAINLAKRIEGESRDGKFSRILVSESARGQLHSLKDESVYRFDKPFPIKPKGISHDINVFEIKHHFLPTDWEDVPSEVSIIYEDLDDEKLDIASQAHGINPTNLWLAEEYLLLSVMNAYRKLFKEGKEDDPTALKEAYSPAHDVAQQIAGTELRDTGLLGICGFIAGEQRLLKEEQRRYCEALNLDEQDGEIHSWLAYSLSLTLDEDFDRAREKGIKIEDFYEKKKDKIEEIAKHYDRALELKPMNPWIAYDYACVLSWWSQADKTMRKGAIFMLINAFKLNPDTKVRARVEPYLEPILEDANVKKLLGKAE